MAASKRITSFQSIRPSDLCLHAEIFCCMLTIRVYRHAFQAPAFGIFGCSGCFRTVDQQFAQSVAGFRATCCNHCRVEDQMAIFYFRRASNPPASVIRRRTQPDVNTSLEPISKLNYRHAVNIPFALSQSKGSCSLKSWNSDCFDPSTGSGSARTKYFPRHLGP
jgi:hypothetical protein